MTNDLRLIEDLMPLEVLNSLSYVEKKGGGTGLPSKLHQWWARRPQAAARATVYATLADVDRTPQERRSDSYFERLSKWGASPAIIAEAQSTILASRDGTKPRVLDLFAGGGAIPLEAARLGCISTAVELNPVAHLIQLGTIYYPQRFGTQLANDIVEWGQRWTERTWSRIGHLYPSVRPDDDQLSLDDTPLAKRTQGRPIAYLWTRTVRCPNPALAPHDVPLVRQTWLAKRKGRAVALKPRVDRDTLLVHWDVVSAGSIEELDFDPSRLSTRGRATCLVCSASIETNYVKDEGRAGRIGIAPLAAVVPSATGRGREYFPVGRYPLPSDDACAESLGELSVQPPDEAIVDNYGKGIFTPLYGLSRFRDLFGPRQLVALCALAEGVRAMHDEMLREGVEDERAKAICLYLGLALDRCADWGNALVSWYPQMEVVKHLFSMQTIPMRWDYAESFPFGLASGGADGAVRQIAEVVRACAEVEEPCRVHRCSATDVPEPDSSFDAVITDPPYYDNISYADLADFFFVWLKRSVGFLFPEHLDGDLTPKRREAVMASHRHAGSHEGARAFYEEQMAASFQEAHRLLKPGAPLVCVYAHKTTLGWAALIEALRQAQFAVTEAWPIDTEGRHRTRGQGSAALASSIFLVARRREEEGVGEYSAVQRQLDEIIEERLDRLGKAGVTGSDLIIATIGAGLRPYTRYASVELSNGEEVGARRFLDEVQGRVLNAVLAKIHGLDDRMASIDSVTRYYVIARFSLGYADIDFDEANNLARTAGVELSDLTDGASPLAQIRKDRVRLLDFEERTKNGPTGSGDSDSFLIDLLHGLLWHAAHDAKGLRAYLDQTRPDVHKLRLVAQALQGKGLATDNEQKPGEALACERLLGAWRNLVDENLLMSR